MLSVGTRLPAYATSMGRVLLAGLPEPEREQRLACIELRRLTPYTVASLDALRNTLRTVARQGYATVDQELEEGLRSVAVPIHHPAGQVTAALNVSLHASRASMATMRRDFLPRALRAARAIEEDLRPVGQAVE
jgi:IclR family pca regulon transcriptional regulator